MDYSTFKTLQFILFFGSAIGFCLWQMKTVRQQQRQRVRIDQRQAVKSKVSRPE